MHTPDSREEQQNISRNDQLHQLEANFSQLFINSKWSNKTRRRTQQKHTSEDSDNDSVVSNNKSPWYPVQRWGHQTVVLDKYLYLIGGYIEKSYSHAAQEQLYRLDCDTFEWERVSSSTDKPVPDHRDSHMMCVLQDAAYMFGGKKDEEVMLEDLWKMTVSSKGSAVLNWSKIEATGSVPPARESAQLCGIDGRYILLFGGTNGKDEDENLVVYDDMYILDTQTNEWREVTDKKGAKVEARDSFGMLEVKGHVYIFGGQGSSVGSEDVFYNDLYKLKLEVNSDGSYSVDIEELFPSVSDALAAAAKRPCGRSSNSMCVVRERYIFIIGGEKGEEMKLDDVWVYDTQDNLWTTLQQKKSRHPHLKPLISHSSSVYQDSIIVFGGMYKDENQHSDQTLVLTLNISDQLSEIRRSQNSVASIQSEDQQHKQRTSDGSLKSVLLEDENNLLTNQTDEQQQQQQQQLNSENQSAKANKNTQQKVTAVKDTAVAAAVGNAQQNDNAVAAVGAAVVVDELSNEIVQEDGEEEDGEIQEEEDDDEEDQNRVIDVGTAGVSDNNTAHQQEFEGEGSHKLKEEQTNQQQQAQQTHMDIENTTNTVGAVNGKEDINNHSYQPSESQLDQHQLGSEGENNQDYTSATNNNARERNSKNSKNTSSNTNNTGNANNNINPVATTMNILQHQQQQHQQHHHPVQAVISEEHILHIRQPYVSMSFLSSVASLIPSPITAFGMLAHNAKSQFASTFQINLMWTPKKDTYMNAANDTNNAQSSSNNNTQALNNNNNNSNSTTSKVNGQLLTRSIDKELIETSHLFFQIFDDSEGFTPQDFIEILYKFDYYQAIQYNKSHKELIQDEQGLQAKTQYGNNLKLASLRIGQNVLFISKNKAYNILNVGLISTNGKINPSLSECIIFLFSMDMKRKVYLSENGDQNKRIILNNIAFLMSEEQLFKHDRGTYLYIFDLKRVPQANSDGYEFQYSVGRKDIVEKKRCFFGEKIEQVERLIDYSLRSSLQHLYSKPPENFHFAINGCRYEFISYSDVLRKQKGMRFLKELNTENVQLLKDLGKVSIYEQVNYNSNSSSINSSGSEAQQAASGMAAGINSTAASGGAATGVGSPSQADKAEKDEVIDQSAAQSNSEQKAEGTTTRKNTSVEFHQGILIYAEERLIGRAECHQFGNAFIDKIVSKTKGQQTLFKYVGIIELQSYFTPNIFHTGLQNNQDDCLMRSGIKAFIKGQKQSQQLAQQQQSQGTSSQKNNSQSANSNNSDKEKGDKTERTRTRSFDAAEEPELRKEIKID